MTYLSGKKGFDPPKISANNFSAKVYIATTDSNKFLNTFVWGGGKKEFHTRRMNINFPRRRRFPPLRCVRHCERGDDRDATPINQQLVGVRNTVSRLFPEFLFALYHRYFFFFFYPPR